jgi:two-component system cell cycle response regulator DivK
MTNKTLKNTTILVVEDNVINMKLFKDLLNFHKYNILEAYTGFEALEIIEKHHKEINLILMDIQLPEINGIDLIQMLKSNPKFIEIPVIALSAHAMDNDIETALKFGCKAYITKPVQIEEFINTVKMYLNANDQD